MCQACYLPYHLKNMVISSSFLSHSVFEQFIIMNRSCTSVLGVIRAVGFNDTGFVIHSPEDLSNELSNSVR